MKLWCLKAQCFEVHTIVNEKPSGLGVAINASMYVYTQGFNYLISYDLFTK